MSDNQEVKSETKVLGFYTSDQFWFHTNQNWQGYYDADLKTGIQPGFGPYESPASKQRVQTLLSAKGVFKRPDVYYNSGPYPETDMANLLRFHKYDYVMQPSRFFDFVSGNDSTVSIAKSAVQCCIDAAEDIHAKRIKHGYCLVRPPGHHAMSNQGMGFCVFNNVVCTAAYLRAKYPEVYKNILILDIDVHHGNGTEEYVLHDYDHWKLEYEVEKLKNPKHEDQYSGVHFISWHQKNLYPLGTGNVSKNNVINCPILPGSTWEKNDDIAELQADGRDDNDIYIDYNTAIWHAIWQFKEKDISPDLILVSAGFDAYFQDPLGRMNLSGTHYAKIAEKILEQFPECPTLWIHEGGYSELGVPFCVSHVLSKLLNTTVQTLLNLPSTTDVFDEENLEYCKSIEY